MFRIVMYSFGGKRRVFMDDLPSYEEAREMCNYYDWTYDDGGYIWDLEIEQV